MVIDVRNVLYEVVYIRRSEAEKQHVVRIWGYLNGQTRGFMNADSRLSETCQWINLKKQKYCQ